jgi:cytoskeleton protein RodZ
MPSTAFGEHLKRERELRGVTLEEVAAATRISPRFLEALESEQWDRLPGGAFNRGFIRSVARFLGLDEESMVAEYALETKGLNQSAASADPHAQGMPRDWRPVIVAAVVVVIVILVAAFAIHYYRARARAHSEEQLQAAPAPATAVLSPPAQPTAPANPSLPGGDSH